jgi:hypothetical protein
MSDRYDNESVGLGLGYGSSTSAVVFDTPPPTSSVDDLMKHYLDQCLTFHREQQQLQRQQQPPSNHFNEVPNFISASIEDSIPATALALTVECETHTPDMTRPVIRVPEDLLAKARAVVLSFSTESRLDCSPSEYRQQRIRHAQKEQVRLHNAWTKNLQYVANREQEKLKQQLLQVEQAKAYEQRLYEQQQTQYIERTTTIITKAGIGTKSQKAQKAQHQRHQKETTKRMETAALYLEGIPTNSEENLIQSLFQSYGTIRKIHFYRNQTTGECKGDCLLVYQLESEQNKDKLIDLVCAQVSEFATICASA